MRPAVETEALIHVKVTPRSSRNQIAGKEKEVYRVKVTCAPVDGKANDALVGFLSEKLGVPKRDIEVVSGKTGRLKRIRIRGLTAGEVDRALEEA